MSLLSLYTSSNIFFEEEYKYSEVRINTDTYYNMGIVTHNKDKELKYLEKKYLMKRQRLKVFAQNILVYVE